MLSKNNRRISFGKEYSTLLSNNATAANIRKKLLISTLSKMSIQNVFTLQTIVQTQDSAIHSLNSSRVKECGKTMKNVFVGTDFAMKISSSTA